MAYSKGNRLPGETASKLGHLNVIKSEWVKSLIKDFETPLSETSIPNDIVWKEFSFDIGKELKNIWVVDGSYVTVASNDYPPKELAFVKTALLTLDRNSIDQIDKENPHPLLLQDLLKNSAIFHATVFPLRNIRTSKGNNYDTVRYIIRDSMKIDEGGEFYKTLKWLVYRKWNHNNEKPSSPSFSCPYCRKEIPGLPYDSDEGNCPYCNQTVFLTDMIGFHLEMDEDSAPDSVASAYMTIMEHLMLFTPIRLLWDHPDKRQLSESLFIKDGPLNLRSQYSKLVPSIRAFLEYAKKQGRLIHIIGQEKSGKFFDHLSTIARFVKPEQLGEKPTYTVLTHEYVRKEVYRVSSFSHPYGERTNWGEKVYVKLDPNTFIVLNIPTGEYNSDDKFPNEEDLIGLNRILATLPSLLSYKFEGALYPIELANGISSMSSYPSASILQRFIEEIKADK